MENSNITTGTLQELINKKAEERLDKELQDLYYYVNSNRLLNRTNKTDWRAKLTFTWKDTEENKELSATDTLDRLLVANWGFLRRELKKQLLPEYIEEITQEFVAKVESLRAEIDQLYNQKADRQE